MLNKWRNGRDSNPRPPCVTGRYSNRLNYRSTEFLRFITTSCHPGLLQFDARQFPTLTWGDPTLPSALRRFTSEFGMGSGGTTALVPPGQILFYQHVSPTYRLICIRAENSLNPPKHLRRCKVKPHGSLVPVSSTHRCAYTPGLSTSSSSTFLQETYSLRENSSRGKFRA